MERGTDLLGDLQRAISRLDPKPTKAVGRVVIWPTGARSIQVNVRCEAEPADQGEREYDGLTLRRAPISGSDLADAIIDWVKRTMGTPMEGYYKSRKTNSAERWPRLSLAVNFQDMPAQGHRSGPTLAYGHPPFASQEVAVKRWFLDDVPSGGQAQIVIEDPRARIDAIEVVSPTLVRVTNQLGPLAGLLELQVIFQGWSDGQVGESCQPAAAINEVVLPEAATRAHAYLISESNELLAEQDVVLPERPLTAEARVSRARRAARDIAQGEHEFVELKCWIRRGHEKGNEVVETIAAFANGTRTGHLYVGVDNRGRPEGLKPLLDVLEGAMKGVAQEARAAQAEAKLREWLRELVEKLQHPPAIDARLIDIDGHPVFSIDVEPVTSGPPCQLHDNAVLVRRGSSNRFPEADRLRELMSRNVVRLTGMLY